MQEGKVSEIATRTTDPEELKAYVARTHVSPSSPPTVIVHGTVDRMVPIQTSEELVVVLREAGVESKLIRVEGADHGFDLVPGVLEDVRKREAFEEANAFVARMLSKL